MNEIGFERFRIQLIENFHCEDKYQLRQKEGEYIRKIGTLNKLMAGRTDQEYREENKEKIKEINKKYFQNNKEKLLNYQKEYKIKNEEKLKKRDKEYREINKEKISGIITCECGCITSNRNISRHRNSKKHIISMEEKHTVI